MAARVEARGVDAALDVDDGQTLALLGPNGSGKSTLLAVLAGLLVPDAGRVELGGRTLLDVQQGGRSLSVPPHRRRIALLAQDPLLFPHLDVLENVAFGPRSTGRSRPAARQLARRWLTEVDALDLAPRPARALSGGQAQRVALARALATEPDLLLLDEPLASLDVEVAAAVRQTLGRVLAGRSTVLVTHDTLDVALLADEVVVLEAGRVVEAAAAADAMRTPRSAFAASLLGVNVVAGTATGAESLRSSDGWVVRGQSAAPLADGSHAVAVFSPAAVSVHTSPPSGSPRNVVSGTVTALEPLGHLVRVRVGDLRADITPASLAALGLAVGDPVHLAVKAAEVTLYPRDGDAGTGVT